MEMFDCHCAKGCGDDESDPTACCPNGLLATLDPSQCDDDPETDQFNEGSLWLDENLDGVPDRTRLLEGAVKVQCKDDAGVLQDTFVSASTRTQGFYSPSGNQILPTDGDAGYIVEGLGPALQFNADTGLRTNSDCTIAFADFVTDKDGERVSALPDSENSPGFFHTEALALVTSVPASGTMNVAVTQEITLRFNGQLDETTIDQVILREMGGATVATTNTLAPDGITINIVPDAPLDPATQYEVVIPTSLNDKFGGTFPAEQIISFRTAS
jgi:hypothetical protein